MKRALAVSLLMLCPAVRAEEPAAFRGDSARTGVYPGPGVPVFHRVKWRFAAGGPIYSSPVVAGATVYVGSNDHSLHALDLETGRERWKFKTGARVVSTPAFFAGTVFFLSYDGSFYAVDAETGSLKWKFATEGERRFAARHIHGMAPMGETMPDPFDFFLSSPAVSGGAVYFGSGDSYVYCLDAATGALGWKFKTGDVVHSSPAVEGGTVFIGGWDSYLYALDAASGKEKWRFKTGEDHEIFNQVGIQASPAVSGGVVYFGCRDSNFYALDAASGKQLWVYGNRGSWVIGSAAVRDGRVYFATSDTGLLHALDAKSGAELFTIDFHRWPMFSSPALSGRMLYLGSHQGRLLAVDLDAQKLAWSFETEAAKANGPALTNEKGGPDQAAAFSDNFYDDVLAGIRRLQSVGWILSSPAVASDTVLFGSLDGNLYAVM